MTTMINQLATSVILGLYYAVLMITVAICMPAIVMVALLTDDDA